MTDEKLVEDLMKDFKYCQPCDGNFDCDRCRAEWLIKNGWRKIPQGAVVMTEEEYGAISLRRGVDMLISLKERMQEEMAKVIYKLLQERGTTYVKEWIQKNYDVEEE